MTSLQKIEAEIAEKKAELRKLEIAAEVLRRIESGDNPQDFSGMKIRECVTKLLKEQAPRHFKEMARESIRRGYTSQKGGDEAAIIQSFWTTLNRYEDEFEAVGGGKYRLKKKVAGKE